MENRTLKIVLPLVVVALAVGVAVALIASRPPLVPMPVLARIPEIRTHTISIGPAHIDVVGQGTVEADRVTTISAQVPGQLIYLSPSVVPGGFVAPRDASKEKDKNADVLAVIDPTDYAIALQRADAAVERSQAAIDQSKAALEIEKAQGALAQAEWERFGNGEPDPLVLRKPQLAAAQAALAAAIASHTETIAAQAAARLALERTAIRAPYAARVVKKHVEVEQNVMAGAPLFSILATDLAEIRVPIEEHERQFLSLPMGAEESEALAVTVHAHIGPQEFTWQGRLVRTEAELDRRTRSLIAVVRVPQPYATTGANPPLLAGTFVDVRIPGRTHTGIAVIPRAALRGKNRVHVVKQDAETTTLVSREIEVLHIKDDEVYVSGGLMPGEQINLSRMDVITEGMTVKLASDTNGIASENPGGGSR